MNQYLRKIGQAPGSLTFEGKQKIENVKINVLSFSAKEVIEESTICVEDINIRKDFIVWINITGLHDTDIIHKIGQRISIHNLVLEDILNTEQRPKVDIYENSVFAVLKTLEYKNTLSSEQISIVYGKDYVITFIEKENSLFSKIKDRIKDSPEKFKDNGSDYLAYSLIDVIVDSYFDVIEKINNKVDLYEEEILQRMSKEVLSKVYFLKHEVFVLRNYISSARDFILILRNIDNIITKKKTKLYYTDLYDHIVSISETIDIYRDSLTNLIELYISKSSNRTNDVMKVLTIISTIFIPLTFIVGVYGMNFKFMPELGWKYGYFGIWVLIISVGISMIIFMKHKKWM